VEVVELTRGTRRLVLQALFIALVTVATLSIRIPMVATQGYLNIGDTMIFVGAVLLGPQIGFVAGAFGSALADLLGGYAGWAPWTFVIKGIEGLLAGLLVHRIYSQKHTINAAAVLGLAAAAAWMIFGYYLASGIIYGFKPALAEIPMNAIQGGVSVVLAALLLTALRKVNLDV
jgi:uncharacterized membrane protein